MTNITKLVRGISILFFPVFVILAVYWMIGKVIVKKLIEAERKI